ncbi:DUF2062 domain-containing protein [Desulfurivibrio dismutans]|uniref:DUF2062 domain-containing protein n=1 Tax=Desulfurivibrio dismutans TaxID=1398908 RepID=UPI0023D984E9|nr:DUF2062 domain-containing protein [Desulfurivibrio alkaliphilus]MDF1614726.1 DUF2062 domain-containing protein [Desulfurivibrio alkaliphilus]
MRARYEQPTIVVVPVYNHGATLREVVQWARAAGWPVLVVDDGSTDDGWQRIADLDCHKLRLPVNKGKGAAIMAGATKAAELGFAWIITVDADGQHDPAEAELLAAKAAALGRPAIVIGARRMVQETVPKASLFGRSFSNFWVRLETGRELPDTQSGMRLYPVRELLALKLGSSRYDFEIEVLVRASWAGVDIDSVDISVHYPPSGERVSHFSQWRDNLRLTVLHTRLLLRRLLPLSHHRVAGQSPPTAEKLAVRRPWQTLKRICSEHTSPVWLATAVWIGLFMGALPLIACHTVAIIYVTHRLHLNKLAAVAASQFCMPPVVPVLCIQVGYFMREGGLLLDLSWEKWLLEIHLRLWDWLLGSLVVGPVLGLIGAGLIYWARTRMFPCRVTDN